MLRCVHILNIGNNRARGVKIIKNYLKTHRATDEVLVRLAFCLYHHAAPYLFNHSASSHTRTCAKKQFTQAITICKNIIDKDRTIKKRSTLNARIHLAQMYAMLKKRAEAVSLARKNYILKPNVITANRLADVYARLGENKEALRWYKRVERISKGRKEYLAAISDLACFYKKIEKNRLAFQYARQTLELIPKTGEGRSMKKILLSHFPHLTKKENER